MRGFHQGQRHYEASPQGRIYGSNILFVTNELYLASRGEPYMTPFLVPFRHVFALLQRGKGLEGFHFLDGHYLLSIDGTGYFSSSKAHCKNCCEKHHRDGRVVYYHPMLGANQSDHKFLLEWVDNTLETVTDVDGGAVYSTLLSVLAGVV